MRISPYRPTAPWLLSCSALALAVLLAGCSDDVSGKLSSGNNSDTQDVSPDDTGNTTPEDTGPSCVGPHCQDAGPTDTETDTGPTCAAEQVCGSECCTNEELCIADACVVPGAPCEHNVQCESGEICEPNLGQCIPRSTNACIYRPDTDVFDPVVHVAWVDDPTTTPLPNYNQVMMTPSVVDITGDGIPDIVFSTFQNSAYGSASVLRAVNGRTYEPVFDLVEPEKHVVGATSIAIGDIDGDGKNEIVAVNPAGGLIAFDDIDTGWAVMWNTAETFAVSWDGPALADLDADGNVEIVFANRVFDAKTGTQLCINAEVSTAANGSIPVDLDGDGMLEVVAGRGAFKFINNQDGTYACPTYWVYEGGASGFPAIGDFGTFTGESPQFDQRDGIPEVIIVHGSNMRLFNGQTGQLIWAAPLPTEGHPHFAPTTCASGNTAGPPTVADFDGDGQAEVAAAGACFYVVFNNDGSLLWKMATQDQSSRVTGSSVFDFQGDGRAEVIYGDECFLRVYDGKGNGDGTTDILFEVANTSGTTRELPVIVDADGDFSADIVVISNNYSSGIASGCAARWPGFVEKGGDSRGVRVIKDRENRWVNTRPVWNQHSYSVTNVCDGLVDAMCPGTTNLPGAIPRGQLPNHAMTSLNNFRQNVQGEGIFDAPDLVVLSIAMTCGLDGTQVEVTVANQGDRGVISGIDVALFDHEDQLITVLQTTTNLLPGGRETLTYHWSNPPVLLGQQGVLTLRAEVDNDGTGLGRSNECREDNNTATAETTCPCSSNEDCEMGYYCADNGSCRPIPG